MLKNIVRLEHKVGDRVYHLLCDNDSPLIDLKDALFQFSKYVGQIEDSIKSQQEADKLQAEEKEAQSKTE